MVNRMRLPLLLAVVVIVAMLLPGPLALAVTPDPPRMMGITSMGTLTGSPGVKITYGANGDAKKGMVTFVLRGYNTQADIDWGRRALRAKVPWGVNLLESWCSQPGTFPGDYDPNTGWIEWSNQQGGGFGSETNTAVCGFTVGGWDGKQVLDSGVEVHWAGAKVDKKPNALGWTDGTNNRQNVATASFRYPFDTEIVGGAPVRGFFLVVPQDGGNEGQSSIYVPSSAKFRELEARVKALEAKAGIAAQDED
jgi:hypothetical protein